MFIKKQLDKNKKKEKIAEEEQSGFVAWILV
jgi:hypothetical protein